MVTRRLDEVGERHPERFRAELRYRAALYRQQIPELREAVRVALKDLRDAQTAVEELEAWSRTTSAK